MDIRSLLQNQPVAGISIVVVLVLLSLWLVLRNQRAGGATYYDLQTGTLFHHAGDALPPVPSPSGGEGVLAHVFACGSCADEEARFIGYLEKYTDEAKVRIRRDAEALAASSPDQPPTPQPPRPEPGRVISAAIENGETPQWIDATHPNAVRIIGQVRTRCGNGDVVRCARF